MRVTSDGLSQRPAWEGWHLIDLIRTASLWSTVRATAGGSHRPVPKGPLRVDGPNAKCGAAGPETGLAFFGLHFSDWSGPESAILQHTDGVSRKY